MKIALIQNMCRNATDFYNSGSILVPSLIFKNVAIRVAHANYALSVVKLLSHELILRGLFSVQV